MSPCERTTRCEGDDTGEIGLSGSTVSRRFIEASAAKRELQEQDLSGEDEVAMFMERRDVRRGDDGCGPGEHDVRGEAVPGLRRDRHGERARADGGSP